jgi:hypothetical protein
MPTLQTCPPSAAARAVPGVLSAIAATKQPKAQVKTRELIIVLVNFVFIVMFSFIVLAFLGFSSLRSHFWPFIGVVRKGLARGYAETHFDV